MLVIETKLPAGVSQKDLEAAFKAVIAQISQPTITGNVHLSFVSSAESQKINLAHAHNDYPTDVLSFAYPKTQIERQSAAVEIVICTPIARAQAKQYNVSLLEEISLLLIHGLMHSLGYDHQTPAEQAQYSKMQTTIMNKIGYKTREMLWSH